LQYNKITSVFANLPSCVILGVNFVIKFCYVNINLYDRQKSAVFKRLEKCYRKLLNGYKFLFTLDIFAGLHISFYRLD